MDPPLGIGIRMAGGWDGRVAASVGLTAQDLSGVGLGKLSMVWNQEFTRVSGDFQY